MLTESIVIPMEDVIAKNLLCGRTCIKCDRFIATRPGDPNIFTPHCHKEDYHPDIDTCELWIPIDRNKYRGDNEFATMREVLKKFKEEAHENI